MSSRFAIVGFGEAGRAFATDLRAGVTVSAYDLRNGDAEMRRAFAAAGVTGSASPAQAVAGAAAIFSLVTADQALAAARDCAAHLAPGALWLDMNSVAPETKRAAARAIGGAGGRYVDVAVMAPVHPAGRDVPLLVSGAHGSDAAALLTAFGFKRVRCVAGDIGAASSIKMIRSVIVKGIEALTAEAMLAAEAAGVRGEVLASLDASERPIAWADRADYNLDRMLVHGARRAAEMEEVVRTLDALGTGSTMSRGTVLRQRMLGNLAMRPADGLDAKLAALLERKQEKVA